MRSKRTVFEAQNSVAHDPAGLLYGENGLVVVVAPFYLASTEVLHDWW